MTWLCKGVVWGSVSDDMKITSIDKEEYPLLIEIWEASVRATHHFLREEDILYFRPLILNEYFLSVTLYALRKEDLPVAFLGVSGDKVEMLFLHPSVRGRGYGKLLLRYAICQLGIRKVDVNEQNQQAVGFYQYMGYKVISRSETDDSGKYYPILRMELP